MPIAVEKNVGVIGMKIYVRGFTSKLTFYTSMEAFFRYALSQPIATAVIGCDTLDQLEQNVYFARSFKPMDWEEQDGFVDAIAPYALMYYKSQYYEKDSDEVICKDHRHPFFFKGCATKWRMITGSPPSDRTGPYRPHRHPRL